MNKKTFMATITLFALLISLVGMQPAEVVRANWLVPHYTPITDLPTITVKSPLNGTNHPSTFYLNFTITEPSSWFTDNTPLGSIYSIFYLLDGANHSIYQISNWSLDNIKGTKNYTIPLDTLSDGYHSLQLTVEGASFYTVTSGIQGINFTAENREWMFNVTETVDFTINNPPTATPRTFPTPAQPQELLFSMPKEYLNYTITERDGVPWAIIDGTYPIYCPNADNVDIIPMVYPTPPNTTNITIMFNGTTLAWSNFTEQYPSTLHHTALGNWAMIEAEFKPSAFFNLAIHYEHPIMLNNGTYQFLYDLNIAEYLSSPSPNSTAYFEVKTEMPLSNPKIYTLPNDVERNELNCTSQADGAQQEVTFEVTSEIDRPLPGDVLFTFSSDDTPQENVPMTWGVLTIAIMIIVIVLGTLVYFRKRKRS